MDLDTLWQSTLGEMEIQLSRASFATWLKNSRLIDKKDGTFYVAVANNFAKEWVENKYQKNIVGILRNFDDSVKKIEFVVNSQKLEERTAPNIKDFEKTDAACLDLKTDPDTGLNGRYVLSSYVVGPSNELAYAAASAIVNEIGKYNPFFIYGGVGIGKTHLIQGIGNEILVKYKKKIRPRYVSSEKFTSDVVWGIRNKRMEDVKKKYRDVDVLIIDDIQFIGGEDKTEEEFFHTFNTLYENNKQIIISSDRPPRQSQPLKKGFVPALKGGLLPT